METSRVSPLNIYIGYDPREDDAYRVCVSSILRHTSEPVRIIKLDLPRLRRLGLYKRGIKRDGAQMIDEVDGRPFSTEFAFSRFLVPYIQDYQGTALFCDCDFLFTTDVAELFDLADDDFAVQLVKHDYRPAEKVKMDGVSQHAYPRKNWSSLMLFNCAHPGCAELGLGQVNTKTGRWLHTFQWLMDEEIGSIPHTWNWLEGVYAPEDIVPKAVHYTLGIPTFAGYENTPYAGLWLDELNRLAEEKTQWENRKATREPARSRAPASSRQAAPASSA
jgi:hypothetical protein